KLLLSTPKMRLNYKEERIEQVLIKDSSYPSLLKKIFSPPPMLYFRGNFDCLKENCFAIVGTRRYSDYGKEIAFSIAADLARAGLVIVSGMSPGIDTFAHLAALEQKQKTIAVLGTGLDEKSIYPKENLELSRRIIGTGGCLISEYPAGTHGSKMTFPNRNRIISGLSLGVLVVEAKYKSGALITANFALKQGKKLFAVPGSIHSLNSQGTNLLIKKGAFLAENANDILTKLGQKELKLPSLFSCAETGDKEIDLIIMALKQGPIGVDEIIEKTKLDPKTVISCLTLLEISDKVRNLGNNVYSIKH
ncbi:MAG: DNA-processing protein DprA, partial [bacterium]|nr:DNA-processing protein DprA [bacterium]